MAAPEGCGVKRKTRKLRSPDIGEDVVFAAENIDGRRRSAWVTRNRTTFHVLAGNNWGNFDIDITLKLRPIDLLCRGDFCLRRLEFSDRWIRPAVMAALSEKKSISVAWDAGSRV